ncbi:uncharacterized protein N7500_003497 [Penicillium coprophilum]|uniref:uncharacterized protein n=1 Tax=Penicillium coprophilum TaxID=36646 RepID=UPI00238577B5|nr:uncharacterized protein N7500_003497 [Penicillium coprophilum]KAJ5170714.1 hypothetical protein N7500_003497 [Penicillium coprophilum]
MHPITHAALAVKSVTDNNSQGALIFQNINSRQTLWKFDAQISAYIQLRIGDGRIFQPLLQRTCHSKGYFIHPPPREMVVGADQQPRALDTLFFPVAL